MSNLQNNTTSLEALLELANSLPEYKEGVVLPALTTPGSASDLRSGKELIDECGNVVTGTVKTVEQTKPVISVDTDGLITVTAKQEEGFVKGDTVEATHQMSTDSGGFVTPGTSLKTAVGKGKYTTGATYVYGDENLIPDNIKSGVSIFNVAGTYTGSSSDGLPTGVTTLASGKYTPTSDKTSDVSIAHGLGVVPNFIIIVAEGTYTAADDESYLCFQVSVLKEHTVNSTTYRGASVTRYTYTNTSGSLAVIIGTDAFTSLSDAVTETYIKIQCASARKLKAGTSYRWIAGVAEGIE